MAEEAKQSTLRITVASAKKKNLYRINFQSQINKARFTMDHKALCPTLQLSVLNIPLRTQTSSTLLLNFAAASHAELQRLAILSQGQNAMK